MGSQLPPSSQCVSVSVRVRPLLEKELSNGHKESLDVTSDRVVLIDGARKDEYFFDHVFSALEANESVYTTAVHPIIEAAMQGTIFAYGQTSSGKTHTVIGSDMEMGLSRLAVDKIFEYIKLYEEDRVYQVKVSIIELYNEEISDLLSGRKGLQLRQCGDAVRVADMSEEVVYSEADVDTIFQKALASRRTASTGQNERSSRSHVVLRLTISGRDMGDESMAMSVAEVNIVDLAGSEQYDHSANDERSKETKSINLSLSKLTTVIMRLTDGSNMLPGYRESKLTRLLQNSLGGNAQTSIICNVTPSDASLRQTKSTLDFARRAKSVRNKPVKNEQNCADADKIARMEVEGLQQRLAELEKSGPDNAALQQENETLKGELGAVKRKMDSLYKQIEFYSASLLYAGHSGGRTFSAKASRRRTIGGALCGSGLVATPSRRAGGSMFAAMSPGTLAVPPKRSMRERIEPCPFTIRESTETEESAPRPSMAGSHRSSTSVAEMDEVRTQLDVVTNENEMLKRRLAELEANADADDDAMADDSATENDQGIANADERIEQLERELAALKIAHSSLESEQVALADENYNLNERLNEQSDQLSAANDQLQARLDEIASLKTQLDESAAAIESLTRPMAAETAVQTDAEQPDFDDSDHDDDTVGDLRPASVNRLRPASVARLRPARAVADPNLEQTAADMTAMTLDSSAISGRMSRTSDVGFDTSETGTVRASPALVVPGKRMAMDPNLEQTAFQSFSATLLHTSHLSDGTLLADTSAAPTVLPQTPSRSPARATIGTSPAAMLNTTLNAQMDQLQAVNAALQEQLSDTQSMVSQAVQQEIERLLSDNQNLLAELSRARERIELIEAEIEARDNTVFGSPRKDIESMDKSVSALPAQSCDSATNTSAVQLDTAADTQPQTPAAVGRICELISLRRDYDEVLKISEKLYEDKVELEARLETVENERISLSSDLEHMRNQLLTCSEYMDRKEMSMAATTSFVMHEAEFKADEIKAQLEQQLTDALAQCDQLKCELESTREAAMAAEQQRANDVSLATDLEELKAELTALQLQLAKEQKRVSDANKSVADYEWMLQEERKKNQSKVAELQQALADSINEVQQCRADAALSAESGLSGAAADELQERLRNAEAQMQSIAAEKVELESRLQQNADDLNDAKQKVVHLSESVEAAKQAEVDAWGRVDALHALLKKTVGWLRSELREVRSLVDENEVLSSLREVAATLAVPMYQKMLETKQIIDETNDRCVKLRAEREQLQSALDAQRVQSDQEIASLRSSLAETNEQLQLQRGSDQDRQNEFNAAVARVRDELQQQLDQAHSEVGRLQQQLASSTETVEQLQAQCAEAQEQTKQLHETIKEKEEVLRVEREQLQSALDAQRVQADQEIASLRSSLAETKEQLQLQRGSDQDRQNEFNAAVARVREELQLQLEQARSEVGRLQQQLASSSETVEQLQAKCAEAEEQTKQLHETIKEKEEVLRVEREQLQSALDAQRVQADQEIASLRSSLAETKEQLQLQRGSDQDRQNEFNAAVVRVREQLQSELEQARNEVGRLQQQLASSSETVEQLQAKCVDAEEQTKHLRETIEEKEELIRTQHAENSANAEQRIAELTKTIQESEEKLTSERAAKQLTLEELTELRHLLDERATELADARAKMEGQRDSADAEIAELNRQLEAAKLSHSEWESEKLSEVAELVAAKNAVELELADVRAAAERATAEQQVYMAKLERRKQQLDSARKELHRLAEACDEVDDLEIKWKEERAGLEEQIERLTAQLKEKQGTTAVADQGLVDRVQQLETELNNLRRKSGLQQADYENKLSTEKSRLRNELERLQRELDARDGRIRSLKDEVRKLSAQNAEPTIALPTMPAAASHRSTHQSAAPAQSHSNRPLTQFESTMLNMPRGIADMRMPGDKQHDCGTKCTEKSKALEKQIETLQGELLHWQNRSLSRSHLAPASAELVPSPAPLREQNAAQRTTSAESETPSRKKRFNMFGSGRKNPPAAVAMPQRKESARPRGMTPRRGQNLDEEPVNKPDEPTCKQQ